MKNVLTRLSILTLAISMSSVANATLIDRGNGMIYDSDQDITWLQDANYAMTSGYDADGRMNWDSATAWANNLMYGGYNDWRLANTADTGAPGPQCTNSGTDCGSNVDTYGSELAYMWYDILGNTPYYDTDGNAQAGWGLTSTSADGVDILNFQNKMYWSGTEVEGYSNLAWMFNANVGMQGYASKDGYELYAWAVRDGDVAASVPARAASVPEPGSLMLLAAGLVGVAGFKRQRC